MSRHWLALLLFGICLGRIGAAHAAFNVSLDPLNFPDTLVGANNNASTTLSATGGTIVDLIAVLHGGADCAQFSLVSPTGSFTVDPTQNQIVIIRFSPSSPGNKTCTIDLKDSPTHVFRDFNVNGKGIAPQISITSPTPTPTLAFGHIDVGFTSATQQVTAKNTGDSTLAITNASLTPATMDFLVVSGTTATTLAPNAMTTWDIACRPMAKDALVGNFRITSDSFTNKTIDIALICTGDQASLTIDTTSLNFGAVQRGTTQMRTITLTNSGNVPVTGITGMLNSTNLGYAFDAAGVPTMVPANSMATVNVTFKPVGRTSGGPTSIDFSGTWGNARTTAPPLISVAGQDANFSVVSGPVTLDFGSFRFDAHEPKKMFAITNDGNAPLLITSPFVPSTGTLAAEYKIELAKGGAVLSPPVAITTNDQLTVTVTPQVNHRIGMVNGTIDVTSNAIGSTTEHIPITGLATAANLNIPPAVEFGKVDITKPPTTQIITIQNTDNDTLDIISLSTPQANPAFTFKLPPTPTRLNANSSLEIPVTYSPTETTAPGTPDMTILSIELTGSLNATATITITGEAVFTAVAGGGGCDAGTQAPSGGSLLIGLTMIGLLRCRRRPARCALTAKPDDDDPPSTVRSSLRRRCHGTSPSIVSDLPPLARNNARHSKPMLPHAGLAIVAAAASHAIAPAARADGIGLAVFEPTPATTGTGFALQTPDVGASGSWIASAVVSYASNLVVLNTSNGAGQTHEAPVERSTLMQIGAAYALLGRFEFGAHMPLYQQRGEGPDAAKGTARGNLALHAKARLLRVQLGAGTFIVGASATALVPTASKGQFTGSDQPEGRLLVLGAFTPSVLDSRLSLSFNAGAVLRKEATYFNVAKKSGIAWGASTSYRILDELWATAEFYGEVTPSGVHQPPMPDAAATMATLSQIEWLAGLHFQPERRVSIGLAIGRGLTSAAGTPDLRGVLLLGFVPGAAPIAPIHPEVRPAPDRDTDGDGIVDRLDRCPREPEDKDGFEDSDGCPDPDNDRDGIADAADRCPNVPETVNGIDDQDGCPEAPNAAASDSAAKLKEAEDTFTHGRELMQQGKYAEACAEFARSQELDPQFGTQYNLAGCYAKLGKLASAWKLYREVAQSDTNATRRERAAAQVTALARRTPKLKLVLPRKPDGAQISLNGADASALIDSETPIDPGNYDVAVEAAAYRAWRKTVAITQEGKVVTVVIQLQPAK